MLMATAGTRLPSSLQPLWIVFAGSSCALWRRHLPLSGRAEKQGDAAGEDGEVVNDDGTPGDFTSSNEEFQESLQTS